jgi:hypothetical protein
LEPRRDKLNAFVTHYTEAANIVLVMHGSTTAFSISCMDRVASHPMPSSFTRSWQFGSDLAASHQRRRHF